MKTSLEHVSGARLPASALVALAGLRRVEGISVVADGDRAWIAWPPGDERVLRAVLPVEGVELFERRGDAWHRAGHRLPSPEVPPGEPVSLPRAITPAPFEADFARGGRLAPMKLLLVRDARPRPTTAALCPLIELARWAELATSAELAAIRGATSGDSALLLGDRLPPWTGSTRYWGRRVLVPIGHVPRPALPEDALRSALGASDGEILRLTPGDGGPAVEAIPDGAFAPLTRAGVRLAWGARTA